MKALIFAALVIALPASAGTLSIGASSGKSYSIRLSPSGLLCKTPCQLDVPGGYTELEVTGPDSLRAATFLEQNKSYEAALHFRPSSQTAIFFTLLISGAAIFVVGTAAVPGGFLFGLGGAAVGMGVGGGLLIGTYFYWRSMDPPSGIDVLERKSSERHLPPGVAVARF